jgi:hypothetical protein
MSKKKPAADFSARARRFLRWCRYAPDLPDGSNVFLKRKRNAENSMKCVWLDETDVCDNGCVSVICPTRQVHRFLHNRERSELGSGPRPAQPTVAQMARRPSMYFATAVLTILSGLFYTAGRHEIGSISADVCSYGGTFCQNPHYVLVGAIVAGLWGTFVSMR